MRHETPHPMAGKTVRVKFLNGHPHFNTETQLHVEDWWDRVTGGQSWMTIGGNPACLIYALRARGLPIDDEVIYGKIEGLGALVHIQELVPDEPAMCGDCGGSVSVSCTCDPERAGGAFDWSDLQKLPAFGDTGKEDDPICGFKLFQPWGAWTWFIVEYDPQHDIAFGLVDGFEEEMGDINIAELRIARGPGGLRIERDLHWKPKRLSECTREARATARRPKS